MPLSINVGLSRKASQNYQSAGVSINVTAELDQALLARPVELRQQIGELYAQAEAALQRQAQHMGEVEASQHPADPGNVATHRGNGNSARGRSDRVVAVRHRNNGNGDSATDSQRRAIAAIARRVNVDPALECRDIVGVELDDLSLRQASELIDHLKTLEPASNGENGR
jgi:hypothetical protein